MNKLEDLTTNDGESIPIEVVNTKNIMQLEERMKKLEEEQKAIKEYIGKKLEGTERERADFPQEDNLLKQ